MWIGVAVGDWQQRTIKAYTSVSATEEEACSRPENLNVFLIFSENSRGCKNLGEKAGRGRCENDIKVGKEDAKEKKKV